MKRVVALGFALGFITWFALGCGSSKPPDARGGGGDPGPKPLAKELPAAESKLADLEKTIAAREKELAGLKAEADALRARIAAAKGGGAGKATPLLDLLATVPKEKWPRDKTDTLRINQLNEWMAKNLVGRRVRYTLDSDSERYKRFSPDGKGKYDVSLGGLRKEKVFGGQWQIAFGDLSGSEAARVKGLSEQAAERLREQKEPIELTFKIKAVKIRDFFDILVVEHSDDIAITGIGP